MTYRSCIREASLILLRTEQAYLYTEDLQRIASDYFTAATRKRDKDSWSYISDLVHFDIAPRLLAGDVSEDYDERIITIHLEGFDFTIQAPFEDKPSQEHFRIEPTGEYAESLSYAMKNTLTLELDWDEPTRFFATLLEFIPREKQ